MYNFQKKKIIIFYQIIGLGLFFLTMFSFIAFSLYPKLNLITQSLLNKLEIICGCANHLSFTNHPFIFSSLILSGLIFAAFFIFVAIKILKIKISTHRFIKAALKNKRRGNSSKLTKIAQRTGLKNKIIEINSQQPSIFCFGFRRPKICISSKLVKKLSQEELIAALLHEKHHLTAHEPVKTFLIKTITSIFFFIPILKSLAKQYGALVEITADEQATQNWQNKAPLARALYKVMKFQERLIPRNNLAISFFTITGERVNKLTDSKYIPKFKISMTKLLISVLFLLVTIIFLVFLTYYTQPVMAHESNLCAITLPQDTTHQCQMLTEVAECVMTEYSLSSNVNVCAILEKNF